MEKSSFFDAEESPSGKYDREYLAEDFASYFARFISNGVFPNPSTGLQVVASEEPDMSVTLQPGYAYINGYKYENTTPLKFEVDVADGLLERDEAIFIRFSRLDRNIKAYKIKGDPSVSAVTPEVTRTADYWDLCVGIIHVTAGIISIDQSLIEDTRLNTELCGIVTTLVTQVDTTTLYNQIQADLKKFQTVSYQEFADWFEDLKGKLGDDPATALQSQIDNIMDGTSVPNSGISVYTHSKSGTVHELTGEGPNGRALMTADVESGDTFTVNGAPVTAYMGTESAADAMAGSEWNGRWVSFVFDGETLNFKGGGGLSAADKAKLIPENIKVGVTLFAGTPKEVVGSLQPISNAKLIGGLVGIIGRSGSNNPFFYNGSAITASSSGTFLGTPLKAMVIIVSAHPRVTVNVCGTTITAGSGQTVMREITTFSNKTMSYTYQDVAYIAQSYVYVSVIGN